jgi:hypothetical protein
MVHAVLYRPKHKADFFKKTSANFLYFLPRLATVRRLLTTRESTI